MEGETPLRWKLLDQPSHCEAVPSKLRLTPAECRVVIAKVNADEHRSLGERFGVQGFPTLKWFSRGKAVDSPDDYTSGRSLDAFTSFIEEQLRADAGFARVDALAPVAKKFVGAEDKAAVIQEAQGVVAGLSDDEKVNGELYIKLLTKAAEKGDAYLTKELTRLEKMMEGGGAMSAHKVEEISRKISVLSAIVNPDVDEK
ncbi:hypothetical protein N2152v2_008762 [Parachlorella kessleri]